MTKLDKKVLRVCQSCAMKHIRDIEKALEESRRQLKIPTLPGWISILVDNALREQIHIARHISNGKLRKAAGEYGGPGKVGASAALDALADQVWQDSVFSHTVCGWLWGDIEKEELPLFADAEEKKAAGSMFNANLCRMAYEVCMKRKGNTVRECLKESEAVAMFKKVARDMGRE